MYVYILRKQPHSFSSLFHPSLPGIPSRIPSLPPSLPPPVSYYFTFPHPFRPFYIFSSLPLPRSPISRRERVTRDLVMMTPAGNVSRTPYPSRSRTDPCLPSVSMIRPKYYSSSSLFFSFRLTFDSSPLSTIENFEMNRQNRIFIGKRCFLFFHANEIFFDRRIDFPRDFIVVGLLAKEISFIFIHVLFLYY